MLSVSERAAALFAPDALRRAAVPLCEAGLEARAALRPFGGGERAAWEAERRSCGVLEAALRDHAGLGATLESALRQLPRIDETARRLGTPGRAEAADLFRAKRFLFAAATVASALSDGGAVKGYERPPLTATVVEGLARGLDERGELTARFRLGDAFDARLTEARADHEATRAALSAALATAAASIEARHGLRLSGGRVRVSSDAPALAELRADPALEVASASTFEVELALRGTEESEALERVLAADAARVEALEAEVVARLAATLSPHVDALVALESWLGRLDLRLAKVRLAATWGCWPEPGDALDVRGGWLPAARAAVEGDGGRYQPLDLDFAPGVSVLTGPNMGGKTVTLALAGAIQYLAQLGYPVPARSAHFAWRDRVDYVGGELGSVAAGLSSFAGEMAALSEALAAPGDALLLIDELGRGTSPAEGRAIAVATARYLAARESTAVIVTHFADVDAPGARRFRVIGIGDTSDADLRAHAAEVGWKTALNSAMDYALVADDGGGASDALRVAALFSLPPELLVDAAACVARATGSRSER
ncbi:MAG: hypothetical protein H6698_08260 [Myxococcales bacterium]|nr:hypothetical protein [Myxococcales bacterium]MCB9534282.1 hypothetical protein [Myxococcales bacterium]